MNKFTAYGDDTASLTIGKLTVENGTDSVAVYGSIDLTRDKQGLAHALALKAVVDSAVQALQAIKDLPEALRAPVKPKSVANPFG